MTARSSQSGRNTPIRFGTSGWRGIVGDEFTLPRARAVARGLARLLRERGEPARVLLASDARPGGARLVREVATALSGEGVRVERADGVTATPVLARAVARRGLGAGIEFTASHNPVAYQGLKVFGARGAVLDPAATRRLERLANVALREGEGRLRAGAGSSGRSVELVSEYRAALLERLDRGAFARTRPRVVYDALHGAGAGVLDVVLGEAGARVAGRRLARDARFGGVGPDPVPTRLADLSRAVASARGLRVGLATDGDADRYAAVDASGRAISASESLALLVDHLARSGRIERGVAISVATGSLVERVARSHGLAVTRHPIGFKFLSAALLAGEVDCAGEESGGFAWVAHGVDKDGILAAALLAEIVAATEAPLGERLAALVREHGPGHCGRVAVTARPRVRKRLATLMADPPTRVAGVPVVSIDSRDGLRLGLPDGFVMLRASGTEPALRVYAEAPSVRTLRARLALGARWLAPDSSGNLAD